METNFAYAICLQCLISMSPMLGLFWDIYEPRYLNLVKFGAWQKMIEVSGYSSSRNICF